MKKFLIAVVVVLGILIMSAVSMYNGLITANENVTGKFSQVENQLQRRNDLIPNLVATVQGIADQEKALVKSVTDARAAMMGAKTPADISQADGALAGALSRLMVVVENYPQIKSDANFRQLSDELAGTENRLAVARKDYNDSVQNFNTKIKTFPTNIFAGMLGFSNRDYLKVPEAAKQVPNVKFK